MVTDTPRSSNAWRKAVPLIILAGLIVYSNSLTKTFVFDDEVWIIENPDLEHDPLHFLGRWYTRWTVGVTLILNYWLGGLNVLGYHLFNLAIHIGAALALFGVVRRTLLLERWQGRYRESAPWLALAAALLWLVHPLQTQSVTYIIQRCESIMGLCYLLTLYAVLRGATAAEGGRKWYMAAVVFTVLGMGAKEVMVTAPLVILLYDRIFLGDSFREVLRRRWGLYACLAAYPAWTIFEVVAGQRADESAGFILPPLNPLTYAMTQAGVILYYLRLSFWPDPLCLDYQDWPITQSLADFWLPGLGVAGLLLATAWALWRRPALGFLGAWFFVILAPTSSIMPIRDVIVEHRMYLSLAALAVLVVLAGQAALQWLARTDQWRRAAAVGLVVAGVAVLGGLTLRRNQDYQSLVTLWENVTAQRPRSARAHFELARGYLAEGQREKALAHANEAVRLNPAESQCYEIQGLTLLQMGRFDEAVVALTQAVERDPDLSWLHGKLGTALLLRGQLDRAVVCFEKAVEVNPRRTQYYYWLGTGLYRQGKRGEAARVYKIGVQRDPAWPERAHRQARRLVLQGEQGEYAVRQAVFLAQQACWSTGNKDPQMLDTLAIAYAAAGQFREAQNVTRRALTAAARLNRPDLTHHLLNRLRLFKEQQPVRREAVEVQ
jgi:tetratricopeptide (TPR) repeat protein